MNATKAGALLIVGVSLHPAPTFAQVCSEPWTLEETLRIGSLDGDDALSGILDLSVGSDGLLYVAQQYIPAITVFDSHGNASRRIGRAGTGPGEIDGWPVRLGWVADTLWAADHAALNFFGPDGRPTRQVYFREVLPAEASILMPGSPLSDGTVLARRGATSAGSGSMEAFFTADSMSVMRLSGDGEILGSIAVLRDRLHVTIPGDNGRTGYATHPLASGWGEENRYAVAPDGSSLLLIGAVRENGRNSTFDLLRVGLDGDTLMLRNIPYQPRELSRSDRSWLTEEFGNMQAGDYDPAPGPSPFPQRDRAARERDRRAAREAMTFPQYFPPVRQLLAGEDGTIWLLRELDLPGLVDRWQVYSAEGELEGEVFIESGRAGLFPWLPRLDMKEVSRDEVWGVTLGEFDEPYIHRYRVDSTCR